jgi:hypothetical protein
MKAHQNGLAVLLSRFSARTYRVVGVAVVVIGIPSVFIFWGDQGAVWGLFILFTHIYIGAFIAFGLPWLQGRKGRTPGT